MAGVVRCHVCHPAREQELRQSYGLIEDLGSFGPFIKANHMQEIKTMLVFWPRIFNARADMARAGGRIVGRMYINI